MRDQAMEKAKAKGTADMKENKRNAKVEKAKVEEELIPKVVELGTKVFVDNSTGLKTTKRTIEDINTVKELQQLLDKTNSRGKRQRIQKKIDKLEGKIVDAPEKKAEEEVAPVTAKNKVQNLLQKRDQKMADKEDKKNKRADPLSKLNEEDKEILKVSKNKKRKERRYLN